MSRSASKKPRRVKSEVLEVVCRLKAYEGNDPCVVAQDEEHVALIPPSSYARNGAEPPREQIYRFGHVFEGNDLQREVFSRCCMDLLEDLVGGKNALLFAYGVTGSGKTYTMTGNNADSGILPRAADVLFNSIPALAPRCAFAPDGKNGFLTRDKSAALDEQRKLPSLDYEMSSRSRESKHTKTFSRGMVATVFVSYVEVYNDYCYDLLDNSLTSSNRLNMNKNVRIDNNGNAFLERITEVEVQSSDEVLLQYMEAQDRRKVSRTLLNSNSSRSHSIFNIRLVMAQSCGTSVDSFNSWPINDSSKVIVSQLSIVDLAGSERAKRTNNCGDRLAETNKINQSLLFLRNCFNQLRSNTNVSYRDCKLTFIFKNFFEGFGRIRMIVCVNPQPLDYEENVLVMSFAEVAQAVDIQLTRNIPLLPLENYASLPYRSQDVRKWYREIEGAVDDNITLNFEINSPPQFLISGHDDSASIDAIREYYFQRAAKHKALHEAFVSNAKTFESHLLSRLCTSDLDRRKLEELESALEEANAAQDSCMAISRQLKQELLALKRRLYRYEARDENARQRADEKLRAHETAQMMAQQQRNALQQLPVPAAANVPSTSHVAQLRRHFLRPDHISRSRLAVGRSRKNSIGGMPQNNADGTIQQAALLSSRCRRSRSEGGPVLNREPIRKIPISVAFPPELSLKLKNHPPVLTDHRGYNMPCSLIKAILTPINLYHDN